MYCTVLCVSFNYNRNYQSCVQKTGLSPNLFRGFHLERNVHAKADHFLIPFTCHVLPVILCIFYLYIGGAQQTLYMGPIRAPSGFPYGSNMGNPYGVHEGFATGQCKGPMWACYMGQIWDPCGLAIWGPCGLAIWGPSGLTIWVPCLVSVFWAQYGSPV